MLLSAKLMKRIKAIRPEGLEYHLTNISINGEHKGCSGFVMNKHTGKIIYVNTEKSVYEPISDQSMYRFATSVKDYTGGTNHWILDDALANTIVDELTKGV